MGWREFRWTVFTTLGAALMTVSDWLIDHGYWTVPAWVIPYIEWGTAAGWLAVIGLGAHLLWEWAHTKGWGRAVSVFLILAGVILVGVGGYALLQEPPRAGSQRIAAKPSPQITKAALRDTSEIVLPIPKPEERGEPKEIEHNSQKFMAAKPEVPTGPVGVLIQRSSGVAFKGNRITGFPNPMVVQDSRDIDATGNVFEAHANNNIPPPDGSLSGLTNSELGQKLRTWADVLRERDKSDDEKQMALSRGIGAEAWKKYTTESDALIEAQKADYLQKYQAGALASLSEAIHRLHSLQWQPSDDPDHDFLSAAENLRDGMLAGPHPLTEMAALLNFVASKLPE